MIDLPTELILEIINYLNKNDLRHLIYTNKEIRDLLYSTETIKFYQKCDIKPQHSSCFKSENSNIKLINKSVMFRKSLFIFKTIFYSNPINDIYDLLFCAIGRGHLEVVKHLVANGANLSSNNNFAVRHASESGHLEVVKYLVANGADLTAKNNYAIRRASKCGHLEVIKFLVANGADLTAKYDYAIRHASSAGHLEVVKFLIDNGADSTAENNSPIRWASENGHLDVVQFLTEKGADFTADNNYSLWWAIYNDHPGVIRYLVANGAEVPVASAYFRDVFY